MPPFFIIGNPRSGTTLLRLMLTCNPRLVVPPECGFALWLRPQFAAADLASATTLTSFARAVVECRKFETWGIPREHLEAFLLDRKHATYGDLAGAVYQCYGENLGKSLLCWGDKNNYYLHHVAALAECFPGARFLHIVRDGRDVACSYRDLHRQEHGSPYRPRLPHEVEDVAREWRDNLQEIRTAFAHLAPSSWTEVGFAELVRDPAAMLERVCAFLQVGFDPVMLEYHELNARLGLEPESTLAWKTKTLEPPREDVIGRYARDLSPSEARRFESIAGSMLTAYGFV